MLILPNGIDLFSTIVWGIVITAIGGLVVEVVRGSLQTSKAFENASFIFLIGLFIWIAKYNLPVYGRIAIGRTLEYFNDDCRVGMGYYENAFQVHPEIGLTYLLIGRCYFNVREFESAIEWLEAGKSYEPRGEIATQLGWSYYWNDQFDLAEQNFREGLRLDPQGNFVQLGLGISLHRQLRYSESVIELQKAVELYPKSIDAHFWYGWALFENDQCAEAIPEFQFIISDSLSDTSTYVLSRSHAGLGYAQVCLQNYGLARQEFENSLEINPEQEDVLEALQLLNP